MADSPPKKADVEPGTAQSPDSTEQQNNSMENPEGGNQGSYELEVKEQDRWLPIANVARIMKMALPDNAKIAKEAKECMQECVSEFISFITSEASEKCQQEKRKTVNGEDILFAMTSLGFENYAEALKIYLARYRETLLANQNKPAGTVAAAAGGTTASAATAGAADASAAAAYGQSQNANNDNLLGGDLPGAEHDASANPFGYNVAHHNGNGDAGF